MFRPISRNRRPILCEIHPPRSYESILDGENTCDTIIVATYTVSVTSTSILKEESVFFGYVGKPVPHEDEVRNL